MIDDNNGQTIAAKAGHFLDVHSGAVTPEIQPSTTFARDDRYELINAANGLLGAIAIQPLYMPSGLWLTLNMVKSVCCFPQAWLRLLRSFIPYDPVVILWCRMRCIGV